MKGPTETAEAAARPDTRRRGGAEAYPVRYVEGGKAGGGRGWGRIRGRGRCFTKPPG